MNIWRRKIHMYLQYDTNQRIWHTNSHIFSYKHLYILSISNLCLIYVDLKKKNISPGHPHVYYIRFGAMEYCVAAQIGDTDCCIPRGSGSSPRPRHRPRFRFRPRPALPHWNSYKVVHQRSCTHSAVLEPSWISATYFLACGRSEWICVGVWVIRLGVWLDVWWGEVKWWWGRCKCCSNVNYVW